jgi:hypothetical protein
VRVLEQVGTGLVDQTIRMAVITHAGMIVGA